MLCSGPLFSSSVPWFPHLWLSSSKAHCDLVCGVFVSQALENWVCSVIWWCFFTFLWFLTLVKIARLSRWSLFILPLHIFSTQPTWKSVLSCLPSVIPTVTDVSAHSTIPSHLQWLAWTSDYSLLDCDWWLHLHTEATLPQWLFLQTDFYSQESAEHQAWCLEHQSTWEKWFLYLTAAQSFLNTSVKRIWWFKLKKKKKNPTSNLTTDTVVPTQKYKNRKVQGNITSEILIFTVGLLWKWMRWNPKNFKEMIMNIFLEE